MIRDARRPAPAPAEISALFAGVRARTEALAAPLSPEDGRVGELVEI